MRTTHTPGPWKAEGWESVIVNDSSGNTLVMMPGGNYGLATVKANAALIAAAPDLLRQRDAMLSVLKAFVEAYSESGEFNTHTAEYSPSELLELARAAIAKAEGGAK